jgi:addiction module HigA family antidote
MKKFANIHPGEVIDKEFLRPLNISAYRLSKEINLPQTRISEIIKGKRRVTADTALRLSKYFGNSPQFWLGLQNDYDLEEESNILKTELNKIHRYTKLMNNSKNSAARI